jgi:hypothetical protein
MTKNTLSFSTLGKLKLYSMQHYLGFSQDRVRMRLRGGSTRQVVRDQRVFVKSLAPTWVSV